MYLSGSSATSMERHIKRGTEWWKFLRAKLLLEVAVLPGPRGLEGEKENLLALPAPGLSVWPAEAVQRSAGIPRQAAAGIPVVAERDVARRGKSPLGQQPQHHSLWGSGKGNVPTGWKGRVEGLTRQVPLPTRG